MKVIITGHTKGIGKCLYNTFKFNSYNVVGMSKSTGYDIEKEYDRNKILEECKNADIFINNAYAPTGQTMLFQSVLDLYQGQSKKIINISSKLSYFYKNNDPTLDNYISEKVKQNEISNSSLNSSFPHVLNVVVGLVETDMSKSFISKKLNPSKLADLIFTLVINNDVCVQQIVVDVPNLNWNDIIKA
jgi:short-subunit dehydrogenase